MGHCRECRFYDGTGCPAKGKMNGGSSMGCFVPTTGFRNLQKDFYRVAFSIQYG